MRKKARTNGKTYVIRLSRCFLATLVLLSAAVLFFIGLSSNEATASIHAAPISLAEPDNVDRYSVIADADTIVVCPEPFLEAIQKWVDYRSNQGHRIQLIPTAESSLALQENIRRHAANETVRNLVLVGDVDFQALEKQARPSAWTIPTFHLDAKVNVHFGSEPQLASDNPYADLDGDGVPELALGRLPVDTPEQLRAWTDRIIRYESESAPGYSSRRVSITAESGGFGVIADSLLDMTTRKFIQTGIPAAYDVQATFAGVNSPFCPDPRLLHHSTLSNLNQGSLFWVYIGHGQTWYLHPLRHQNEWFKILDVTNMRDLNCVGNPAIAVFFCCYTGAFDGRDDCLAESMVIQDGGPIASLAATRVTMPFAMTVFADALMKNHFNDQVETLGELVLNAKQLSTQPVDSKDDRAWMHALARVFSPTREVLDAELKENVALFHLLGDPLLRLPRNKVIDLDVQNKIAAGETLIVRGEQPIDGRLTVELAYRRDRLKFQPKVSGREQESRSTWARWQDEYQRANDRVCRYLVVDQPVGPFELELYVPSYCKGACTVRAFSTDGTEQAIGATELFIDSVQSTIAQQPSDAVEER